ncbi:MAG: hypothetical protein HYX25_07425 [Candidatus Solibacter usitatus]|nr:hypothetical protein [Candidatus Solibacter usitatus]
MPASRRFFHVAIFLFAPLSIAQVPEPSPEGYIEKIFETRIGELPRMGWFAPTHGFLAEEGAAKEVNLFAPVGLPSIGRKKERVARSEIMLLRKMYRIACEIEETDHLTAFDVGGETGAERALYTTRKILGETHAGIVTIPLDGTLMARVNRLLKWPSEGTLRRDEAIGVRTQSFYYSLHKLYNTKTGLLSQEAIVLHRKDGEILAHSLTAFDPARLCDGCAIPSYVDASSGTYLPLNMFELPGFVYPVLLLETGTTEGRALSLLTFTPDGKLTEFRVYEYVVHCG